jgi:hypothetical protein
MPLTQIVGLVASRQVAIDRGAPEDEALRAGLVGYVAPVAGLVVATTTQPPPATPQPRPEPVPAPADGAVPAAVQQLAAAVTLRVQTIRREHADQAADETAEALNELAGQIEACAAGIADEGEGDGGEPVPGAPPAPEAAQPAGEGQAVAAAEPLGAEGVLEDQPAPEGQAPAQAEDANGERPPDEPEPPPGGERGPRRRR